MKISLRHGMFETNSSSMHSLIITNQRKFLEDEKENYLEYKNAHPNWYSNYVDSKKDKALFLGGIFNYSMHECGKEFKYEYTVFMRLLRDNHEDEIIKEIEQDAEEYKCGGCNPGCAYYFDEGPLFDCTCDFYSQFKEYFKIIIYTKDKDGKSKRKELYKKLYDFIYGDGVILTYEQF